jgi:hypothetical protein
MKKAKHIEMVPAVLNNRRIWQKYIKNLSLLKKLFQNKRATVKRSVPAASKSKVIRYTCKFLCMCLIRDNFFGFAWTSVPRNDFYTHFSQQPHNKLMWLVIFYYFFCFVLFYFYKKIIKYYQPRQLVVGLLWEMSVRIISRE